MKIIKSIKSSKIVFGDESLAFLDKFLKKNSNKYSKIFILLDENTHEHCLPVFLNQLEHCTNFELLEINAGEENKVLAIAEQLWISLAELNADRNALLINLGGGVVGDLGGFVASCYKRGIDFIQVPTSLLAMVDASIGGKTAIDFLPIKNLIGTFSLPKYVISNPLFLETLSDKEFKNGMAEVIKHALIADKKLWDYLTNKKYSELKKENNYWIEKSIEIKNNIVVADPKENGLRKTLNYGHTVGHAIESFFMNTEKPLLHGEAIIIGMLVENNISSKKGLLSLKENKLIFNFFNENFKLPKIKKQDISLLIEIMQHDKKNNLEQINCALLKSIGVCMDKVACSKVEIEFALNDYNSSL